MALYAGKTIHYLMNNDFTVVQTLDVIYNYYLCILLYPVIQCNTPPNWNFTLLNMTGNKVGDSATYWPSLGFQLSIGVLKVKCSDDGKWQTSDNTEIIDESTLASLATLNGQ